MNTNTCRNYLLLNTYHNDDRLYTQMKIPRCNEEMKSASIIYKRILHLPLAETCNIQLKMNMYAPTVPVLKSECCQCNKKHNAKLLKELTFIIKIRKTSHHIICCKECYLIASQFKSWEFNCTEYNLREIM